MRGWGWLALVGSLAGIIYGADRLPDPADPVRRAYLAVPPPGIAQMVGGFRGLAADLYYLRFVGYWGYQLTHGRHFQNMTPLLDLITDLDPRFRAAYACGWVALGDAGRPNDAATLMDKGARTFPQDYWFPYQAGLALFFFSEDYLRAAKYFEKAARMPNAGPEPAFFAARMYERSTRRDLAIATWVAIYRNNQDPKLKQTARNGLKRLGALDRISETP